jgi:hypothetical protein
MGTCVGSMGDLRVKADAPICTATVREVLCLLHDARPLRSSSSSLFSVVVDPFFGSQCMRSMNTRSPTSAPLRIPGTKDISQVEEDSYLEPALLPDAKHEMPIMGLRNQDYLVVGA